MLIESSIVAGESIECSIIIIINLQSGALINFNSPSLLWIRWNPFCDITFPRSVTFDLEDLHFDATKRLTCSSNVDENLIVLVEFVVQVDFKLSLTFKESESLSLENCHVIILFSLLY